MKKYRWNKLQKSAMVCWGVGALLILLGFADVEGSSSILCFLGGITFLASGGTLYTIGSNREQV